MKFVMLELLESLEIDAPHVLAAYEASVRRIDRGREEMSGKCELGSGVDLIAFGSLARREATQESDFDYLILVDGIPEEPSIPAAVLEAADGLRYMWATEDGQDEGVRPPGATGLFGDVVGAFDLIDRIGLERDTNHSLTRRMLLLEESVSLLDPMMRERTVRAALDRYLVVPKVSPETVPRYLLNDVLRYWRTITVDYQAKVRVHQKVGLRYLKLLIPRKVQFASMLMSLLLCGKLEGHEATTESLFNQLELPPLKRLLAAHEAAPEPVKRAMVDVVSVVDHYLESSSQHAWREAVAVRPEGPEVGTPEFEEMRERAKSLQRSLEVIFFDWALIGTDARQKLVF